MNNSICKHSNLVNKCKECEASKYKARVVFMVKTGLGVFVEDSIYHVDYKHAERWVKKMGNKIKNATIIY